MLSGSPFINNQFSMQRWSALKLRTVQEVMNAVKEMKLIGRVVKDIRSVGMGYNWRADDIGEASYRAIMELPEEQRRQYLCEAAPDPAYPEMLYTSYPEGLFISCCAELDEPLLVRFEDGDILAIDFSNGDTVQMSLNTVPWDIEPGTNDRNFHANRLFADIIGKSIRAVDVTVSTDKPKFMPYPSELEYILTSVSFQYEDVDIVWPKRALRFSCFIDYTEVELIDHDGGCCKIPYPETREVIRGFVDPWELEEG